MKATPQTQFIDPALFQIPIDSSEVEESSYYWKGAPIIFNASKPLRERPTLVELFCGCGGTSQGFSMAGFEVILGADIHRPSVDTFRHNHKQAVTVLGDLRKISTGQLRSALPVKKIDVMVAGVPCQGFSLNNRKRHADDKRNFLFEEYMRFVRAIKPRVAVLENVSGMRSTASGEFVKKICEAFEDAGYENVVFKMLNAADYGVPQSRQRLIFVATRKGDFFSWPQKTHGPDTQRPYRTVRDAIGDLPSLRSGETVDSYTNSPFSDFQKLMRKNARTLSSHVAPNHPKATVQKIAKTKPGEPMYPRFKQRIRLSWDMPSPTQVSGGIRPQFQFGHPEAARGLSIRERCRIQSFPDDFVVFGGTVQARVQTGNAVPPLFARAIAEEIKKTLGT